MGHGRHTYSPPRNNVPGTAIKRALSSSTRCTSTFSLVPSAFAQSPVARKHTTFVTTPTEKRHSIRVVHATKRSRSTLTDRRPLDEKRNSYFRKRASAQSPFFSAGTRADSSTYKSPPAFIAEAQSPSRSALSPISLNAIVRPDDDVVAGKEKEIPQPFKMPLFPTPATKSSEKQALGNLRKIRAVRQTTDSTTIEQVIKPPQLKSSNTVVSKSPVRRASTRHSLRAFDVKSSLNDQLGQ